MRRKVTSCTDIQSFFLARALAFGIVQPYGLLSCASSSKTCCDNNARHVGHMTSQMYGCQFQPEGHARKT
jgi:hypothetical protein